MKEHQIEHPSKEDCVKWRIKTLSQKYRYFTQKDIDVQLLREEIANTPVEELRKRNNVEATIFQLGYHYPNDKSHYRGLIKHQMWANNLAILVVGYLVEVNELSAGIEGLFAVGENVNHYMLLASAEDKLAILDPLNICPEQLFDVLFGKLSDLLEFRYPFFLRKRFARYFRTGSSYSFRHR